MHTTMRIERPDEVEVTLKVTMTLKGWRELQQQLLSRDWPSWKLSSAITDMVYQMQSKVEPAKQPDGEG